MTKAVGFLFVTLHRDIKERTLFGDIKSSTECTELWEGYCRPLVRGWRQQGKDSASFSSPKWVKMEAADAPESELRTKSSEDKEESSPEKHGNAETEDADLHDLLDG